VSLTRELLGAATDPYHAAGKFAYHYARGKLAHDPVYEAILPRGLLARRARVLDLGCGQGLLAALLVAARSSSPETCAESISAARTVSSCSMSRITLNMPISAAF